MAQTSGFDPKIKFNHVLAAKYLMSVIGLLVSMGKMIPEGCLYIRSSQWHIKKTLRYPQSLDTLFPWSISPFPWTISAHLEWQKILSTCRRVQTFIARPQFPNLYRCLKCRLGHSLGALKA